MTTPRAVVAPSCPYCGNEAKLADKRFVTRGHCGGRVWHCPPCKAWVEIDPNSIVSAPLGTLAKKELRAKRIEAIFYFNRMWRSMANKHDWKTRSIAFVWLAREMQIPYSECNIYAFDEAASQVVIDICSAVGEKKDVAA